jgi:adenylate cyclase
MYRNRKTVVVLLIAFIAALSAWSWRIYDPQPLASVRDLTFDTYQRIKPRVPLGQPIRVIDIDEASIAEFGQWPWPRTTVAQLVDRLRELGIATLAFDMVFSEPDRTGPSGFIRQLRERNWPGRESLEALVAQVPENDAVLAESIGKVPTVLGFFNESRSAMGLPEQPAGFAILGEDPKPLLHPISSSVMSLDILRRAAAGSGSISLARQSDDVVRRVPMFSSDGAQIYPALAIEALRVAQGADTYVLKTSAASGEISAGALAMTEFKVGNFVVPVDDRGNMLIYYARSDPALFLSAKELLTAKDDALRPLLEGHLIFVGASAAGLRDIRVTALGENIPGVAMHAQMTDQILSGTFLRRPDWATGAEIAAMIAITALIVVILPFAGPAISAAFGAILAMLVAGTSWLAFTNFGLLIDPLFPMLTGGSIFLMTNILLFTFAEREKRFVRGAFQRYLAPDLLQKLERNPDSLKLGGEIRELTIMFMDVRGFTPISERLTPEELVEFLNRLLSPLSDIIQQHQGAIDKYIGDSIMAFWNAPLDVTDHPEKAARAALEMLRKVDELNQENSFGFRGQPLAIGDVNIGIGLSTGEGCVGNMGSASRFNYSVVGDTVNIAARIESSCKNVGWPILVSKETASRCSEMAVLEAGAIELKGKSRPEPLYALIGDERLAETAAWRQLAALHQEFLTAIRNGETASSAWELRDRCIEAAPVDLTNFYDGFTMPSPNAASKHAASENYTALR